MTLADEMIASVPETDLTPDEIWSDRAEAVLFAAKAAHADGRSLRTRSLDALAQRRGWSPETLAGCLAYCVETKRLMRYEAPDGETAYKIPFTRIFEPEPADDPVPFKPAQIVETAGPERVEVEVASVAPLGSEEYLRAAKAKKKQTIVARVAAKPKETPVKQKSEWCTLAEAMKILGVSAESTVRRWAYEDKITSKLDVDFEGLGRKPMVFKRVDVEAMAAERAKDENKSKLRAKAKPAAVVAAKVARAAKRLGSSLPKSCPAPADASDAVKRAVAWLHGVGEMLFEKNAAYGDSAANPVRIFSRAPATEGIRVRIDDKLSRIARGDGLLDKDEDVVRDMVGYLALLQAVKQQEAK